MFRVLSIAFYRIGDLKFAVSSSFERSVLVSTRQNDKLTKVGCSFFIFYFFYSFCFCVERFNVASTTRFISDEMLCEWTLENSNRLGLFRYSIDVTFLLPFQFRFCNSVFNLLIASFCNEELSSPIMEL